MVDFDAQLDGFKRLLEELEEMEEDLRGDERWIVGTGVEYAIYLEFGTSKMDPKPFFRPVISEVRQKGVERFLNANTEYTASQIEDLDSLVTALALAIERRVKEVITEKGLIDTGTLRASVAALPGTDPRQLATEEDLPDTGSGPPYPPDFGAEAREQIEVNA